MTALGRPGILVVLFVSAAFVLHPAVRSWEWLPARHAAVAALLLLVAVALFSRALTTTGPGRLAAWLLAVGAVLVVGGVGGDGLLGHRGTLDLVPGQARTHFAEIGIEGQALGLRPLGFTVRVERILPGGGVALARSGSSDPLVLTPERAVAHGGFRFGRPRTVPTGAAARLRVAISGSGGDVTVDLEPGKPAQAGDLRVALQEYFPDFALDEQRQPFTRSREPRNPGAILSIESPRGSFRAFVLRSMPGVHRVEEIGRSFALVGVEPEKSVEIDVHREPLAALVLLGALLVLAVSADGLTRGARARRASGSASPKPVLVAGVLLVLVLLLVDGGAVLSWTFGVETEAGRVALPGAGVGLGLALLAALGGVLLLGGAALAGDPATEARRFGVFAFWGALVAASFGGGAAFVRAGTLAGTLTGGGVVSLAVLLAAVGALAITLLEGPTPAALGAAAWTRRADLGARLATALAVAVAVAAGVESWWREGTYVTTLAAAAGAAALLGLAALEPGTRLAGARHVLFLAALLALVFV